jgi:hypothetical protein
VDVSHPHLRSTSPTSQIAQRYHVLLDSMLLIITDRGVCFSFGCISGAFLDWTENYAGILFRLKKSGPPPLRLCGVGVQPAVVYASTQLSGRASLK